MNDEMKAKAYNNLNMVFQLACYEIKILKLQRNIAIIVLLGLIILSQI